MARLIDDGGPLPAKPGRRGRPEDPYGVLVRAITGQQLSVKAADSIWKRFVERFGAHADARADPRRRPRGAAGGVRLQPGQGRLPALAGRARRLRRAGARPAARPARRGGHPRADGRQGHRRVDRPHVPDVHAPAARRAADRRPRGAQRGDARVRARRARPRPPSSRRSPSPGVRTGRAPAYTCGGAWTTSPPDLATLMHRDEEARARRAARRRHGRLRLRRRRRRRVRRPRRASVPEEGGLQENVRAASQPDESIFPSATGKTLNDLAEEVKGGGSTEVGLATSVFTVGENRLAFGMIDDQGQFVYGPTAVYVAPTPDQPAEGPFLAPADVLITEGRYRSRQAAEETDPFAAVYQANVQFDQKGPWAVLAVTQTGNTFVAAPANVTVVDEEGGRDPRRRRGGAEGGDRHAGLRRRQRGPARHAHAAERHARAEPRQGGRQEARGAAVLDPAALPVARLRAGDRHRRCSSRPSTATRSSSSTRRSTSTTIRTRGCASRWRPSGCGPSRGCS